MTGIESAIPLPARQAAKPALTFSPSTRFPAAAEAAAEAAATTATAAAAAAESDEAASDPDDQMPSQLEPAYEQLRRDKARDAIRKEKVHMEGFLSKKAGGASKAWNKRWCVLRSQALLIYKRYSEEKLKRIIRADEIVDVRPAARRNREFVFEVETPERSFCFEASSDQELESWLSRLRAVVAAVNTGAADDATAPRRSTDGFRSLPAAPGRRAHDAPAQAIFADHHHGLRITTRASPPPLLHASTQLPPGIGPDHEPVPVADEGEDDDEPNFSEEQRREIEHRLEEDRVVLRGYLLKQDKLRQWRRRWFVLRQNTLSYYHDDKEYEVKQILRHHDVYDVRAPDPSTAKARSLSRTYFKIVAAKRNYWLAHDDAAVAREWFTALLRWSEAAEAPAANARPAPVPAAAAAAPVPAAPHSLPAPSAIVPHRVYSPATSPADRPPSVIRRPSNNALDPFR
ncbi:hypothetical protein H4R18_003218 [Coemansia javaensis]|uniref:PH domain-containing protein n=1 Tax=Coemansia javaensis TaxID=2761396 RepID=A0A9W8LHM3_9FUNG|nr:hypothetical protein H4R18_003218 [Coemansia javaensis]